MKKKIVIILVLLLPAMSFSQDSFKKKLSFDFGYNFHAYEMTDLNRDYVDAFASQTNPPILEEGISSGESFQLGLQYRPMGLFDIGLMGTYQYGERGSNRDNIFTDASGNTIRQDLDFSLRTEALSLGVASSFYISHVLGFHDNSHSFLNHLNISLELQAGMGFSKVKIDSQSSSNPLVSSAQNFTSQDFQGTVGIKSRYEITGSDLLYNIGFRIGYQYLKTGNVENRIGNEWVVLDGDPITLDFSGLYYGVFVGIGK